MRDLRAELDGRRLERVRERPNAELAGAIRSPAHRGLLRREHAGAVTTCRELRVDDPIAARHEDGRCRCMHLRGIRGELSVRVAAPAPRVAARRQRAGVRVARGKLDGPIGQRDGRGRVRRGSPAEHLVGERSGRRDEAAVIDAERDSRVDAIGAQRRRRRSPKDTATLRRCSSSRVRPALLVCDLPLFAPVVCGAVVDPLEQPTTSTDTQRADVRMQCNVGRATPIWKIILARLFTSWRGGRARNLTLPSNGRPLRADCARLALALYSVEAGIKFGELREGTRGGLCAARTRHARVRGLRAKPGSFGARCYGATRIASASTSSLSEHDCFNQTCRRIAVPSGVMSPDSMHVA